MFNDNGFDGDNPFSPGFFAGGLRHNFPTGVNPNGQFTECYRCFPIAMMQSGNEREMLIMVEKLFYHNQL
ncbi:unnamed protein product [Cunninghamella blakesleeana]